MENYELTSEKNVPMNAGEYGLDYDIPDPIDQWAVEDFEQFASLIVDAD